MLEKKLLGLKKVRIGGVSFLIRKLSPQLFLDKEYMFPFSDIKTLEVKKGGSEGDVDIDKHKDKIKDIILKGVYKVKYWFDKKDIEEVIDDVMKRPDVYLQLFTVIINHTMGVKKNYITMKSTSSLRYLFIV